MSEPLSEERLTEIRQRVEKTTPGPWELEVGITHDEFAHYTIRTHDPLPPHPWSPRYIAWLTGGQNSYLTGDRPPIKVCESCGMVAYRYRHLQRQVDVRVDEETAADAAFIAQAPTDVRDLLAEVERLRKREDDVMLFAEFVAGQRPEWLKDDSMLRRRLIAEARTLLGMPADVSTESEASA